MSQFDDHSFFDKVEKKTSVNQQDLLQLAQSVEGADFKDEETVRQLISQVASLANADVSQQKEDQLVEAITQNKIPLDLASLSQLFSK